MLQPQQSSLFQNTDKAFYECKSSNTWVTKPYSQLTQIKTTFPCSRKQFRSTGGLISRKLSPPSLCEYTYACFSSFFSHAPCLAPPSHQRLCEQDVQHTASSSVFPLMMQHPERGAALAGCHAQAELQPDISYVKMRGMSIR